MPVDPIGRSDVNHHTRQRLSNGPRDMPDRGGKKPNAQVTSSQCDLSRTAHPVANLENRAGMGRTQITSSECSLSRKDSDPYGQQNAIDPGYNMGITPNTGRSKRR